MKNIVICCDGTYAKYGTEDENTNVVRLFERLGKDGEKQISYYDPGVGTYSPVQGAFKRWKEKLVMAASGAGVQTNVEEAYKYLMDHYEPGDKVYLFGYSRGAHTVRVLAGMLHKCGLLTKGSNNLVPYATKIYKEADNGIAAGFKGSFSRECKPYFIGVWDTVASMGWLWWRKYFPNHRLNGDVTYGYQALSVDERRKHFQAALWDEDNIPEGQEVKQVWFSGHHADVGGQKADRGISDITLEWMMRHAQSKGLKLRESWRDSLQPDPLIKAKSSPWYARWVFAEQRSIPEGANIHRSVSQRKADPSTRYHPSNLPESPEEVT